MTDGPLISHIIVASIVPQHEMKGKCWKRDPVIHKIRANQLAKYSKLWCQDLALKANLVEGREKSFKDISEPALLCEHCMEHPQKHQARKWARPRVINWTPMQGLGTPYLVYPPI